MSATDGSGTGSGGAIAGAGPSATFADSLIESLLAQAQAHADLIQAEPARQLRRAHVEPLTAELAQPMAEALSQVEDIIRRFETTSLALEARMQTGYQLLEASISTISQAGPLGTPADSARPTTALATPAVSEHPSAAGADRTAAAPPRSVLTVRTNHRGAQPPWVANAATVVVAVIVVLVTLAVIGAL